MSDRDEALDAMFQASKLDPWPLDKYARMLDALIALGWRKMPSRESVVTALESPDHAPMETHSPSTGECLVCPWPIHGLGASRIADAVLALMDIPEPPISSTTTTEGA